MPGTCKLISNVRKSGFITDAPRRKHIRTPENIEAMAESVLENPLISICHLYQK